MQAPPIHQRQSLVDADVAKLGVEKFETDGRCRVQPFEVAHLLGNRVEIRFHYLFLYQLDGRPL